ncbi:MAG TPA: FtsQ-type POTRA domain-containing protein [Blastocatellia bacterium]|nr:FtsQ-type POTRA domain-containing protein [Blastocatellia bacterium]
MAIAQRGEPRGRAQVVAPRAPRRLQQSRSRGSRARLGERLKSAAVLVKPAVVLITIALLIVGYNALAGSRFFELHYINVSQASPALQAEIEQTVKRAVGQTKLLDVSLAALKEKVEKLPQVRTATVARLLPDGLFVQVVERHPAVLVRRQSASQEEKLVWLDEDAVEMGEFAAVNAGAQTGEMREVPPIAKGFEDGNRSQAAVNADRERIAVYKKLEGELGDGASSLWNLIDEIDLRDVKDVNLSLARPHVLIHVGSTDFRKRFEIALTIIQAAKSGDAEALRRMRTPEQRIEQLIQNANNFSFIDTARSDRIVVNFASPGVTQAPVQQETKPTQGKKR